MNKVVVSIIMPIYNAEKYLKKSIESVLNQSLKDFELILVNDGSIDNSLEIINIYAKNDNRIKVIDKRNEGVSIARNIGIKVAMGEYIAFIDADDYIKVNMFEEMINYIKNTNSDIAMCNYIKDRLKDTVEVKLPWKDGTVLNNDQIKLQLIPSLISGKKRIDDQIMGSVWRIVTKKNIIENVKFNKDIKIAEDLLFCIELFSRCEKMVVVEECFYFYARYEETTLEKYRDNFIEESMIFHNNLISILDNVNLLEKNKDRYLITRLSMYTTAISNCFRKDTPKELPKYKCLNEIINSFNNDKLINEIELLNNIGLNKKALYFLMKFRAIFIIYIIYDIKEKIRYRTLK